MTTVTNNSSAVNFTELFDGVAYRVERAGEGRRIAELSVTKVCSDSRECDQGTLFVALTGLDKDGHDYIGDAIARGCRMICCQVDHLPEVADMESRITIVSVQCTLQSYSRLAANFYGNPAREMIMVGITGTNGKTTVTYLLEHILRDQGLGVGVIGTVNNRYTAGGQPTVTLATRFTTPEAVSLQKVLREMADAGIGYVIMEVSSHALSQARVGTIRFAAAAFTNLSRDHLDYHRDMEEYFQAKLQLFTTYLQPDGVAVLPQPSGGPEDYLNRLRDTVVPVAGRTLSWGDAGDLALTRFEQHLEYTRLTIAHAEGEIDISTPIVGRFNIDNILCALALAESLGVPVEKAAPSLVTATGAPGRLERVSPGAIWPADGPVVLVDYAHTPDALEKVLMTIKALPHRELVCVFGCGGDRDRGKRPLMGAAAARYADVVVVSDDNPRTENGEEIVAQILPGITPVMTVRDSNWLVSRKVGEHGCVVLRNRSEAIEQAIRGAGTGDLVLIAGKGHEPYQLTLQGKRYFDDRQEAMRVLLSWTEALIREATGGTIARPGTPDMLYGAISTDSRRQGSALVFVALKGDTFDGHDFAAQAVANGACCLVVERELSIDSDADVCQVVVGDSLAALGALTGFRRRRLAQLSKPIVIGLTGSCGKTTVKEMTAAILERKWPEGPDYQPGAVLKTTGNFNNLIGVPLSLLPLHNSHRAAVIEMGMNAPGELTRLGGMVFPDISCITNVYGAHLEGLATIEGVARAKEELFQQSGPAATLVINQDDPYISGMAERYSQKKVTFGRRRENGNPSPDFYASKSHFDRAGMISFTLHHGEEAAEAHLFTAGEHNITNALAAAAIASVAGAEMPEIVAGLGDFRPSDKRMAMMRTDQGYLLINDTYNANPASMAAGLKTLVQLSGRLKIAIVGDMRELGETSVDAHRAIGRLAAELRLDHLLVVGEFRQAVKDGAVAAGLAPERVDIFTEKTDAVEKFLFIAGEKNLGQDDAVLVKASRGLRFETIVERISTHK